jgi:aspartyl-tRNA(Asn)/glutamyl-tRNA(Gln) amidotransferase subunit C
MADASAPAGPTIDAAFVRRVAALARLELDDAQLPALTEQFQRILAFVGAVASLDVPLEGAGHLAPLGLEALRPDEPGPTLARRDVTRNAPAHDGAFLVVPKFRGDGD